MMSRSARKRQARLAFTPLPSSSPASKGYNQQIRDRAAKVSIDNPSNPTKRRKLLGSSEHTAFASSSRRDKSIPIPTPDASLKRDETEAVDDTDDEPIRSTYRHSHSGSARSSKGYGAQQRIDFSKSRDPSSFDSPIKLPSSSRASSSKAGIFNTAGQSRIVEDESSEASDGDTQLPSPSKFIGMSARTTTSQPAATSNEESESDEIVLSKRKNDSSEDDDDDMPTAPGKRKRRQRHSSLHRSDSLSPPRAVDSDDDVIIVEPKGETHAQDRASASEEEGSELITPRRRRLKRKRQFTQQEKDDLDEDMDFLGPSSDIESSGRTPRTTQSSQKSARMRALEALKRKRNGNLERVDEEPEEVVDGVESGRSETEQSDIDELHENEEEDDDEVQIISSRQMFQAEEEDADFLTDGEDAPLGVPDRIPIQFTKYASMKPKELFKYAVDWMVQRKINPAFEGDDELYQLSFKKLDDEVRALAGSKFTSSAWTSQFTVALHARPEIAYEPIDRSSAEHFFRDKCDACNRGSHPATFEIRFIGNPYHHQTLEEVANDDEEEDDSSSTDSDSDEKDDKPAYDEQGRKVPPASTIFYVGKFCMANAHTAHSLRHWRYHLNEWVITWLTKEGYCSPEKVVERDGWKKRKRGKYANKIVDRMVEKGTVKELWRSFRDNIDEARNSKQGRYGGESP